MERYEPGTEQNYNYDLLKFETTNSKQFQPVGTSLENKLPWLNRLKIYLKLGNFFPTELDLIFFSILEKAQTYEQAVQAILAAIFRKKPLLDDLYHDLYERSITFVLYERPITFVLYERPIKFD